MKDKTLPDKEIVKALEECIELRFDDTEYATVRLDTLTNALDLITRQQAEKEALIAGQETLQKYIAQQKIEIERLKNRFMDMERSCYNGRTNGVS